MTSRSLHITPKFKNMINWNIIRNTGREASSNKIRKSIVSFITRHHPCSVVSSIERKYNAYKIQLMSGMCLVFDADGRFVKMN
ncbi:hypothetical protein DRF57_14690 [Chryseobacterium rhizosphaerae]|uniref:Beta-lactamase-inhibitor-like PepSY-like domain-containing protein n=2 Tax=Chryseobacterium rhizosphaerae TaxID=395937 RepID=A0ABX9IJ40_9FLAO|nr:hypothetical protein DRF57_14690 [Chryseobacterium rhizosphaerae]